jgi:hypothetical protein
MLYPKNFEKKLSPELFKNPTAEYRGTPFWAWNCKLDKDLLLREIDYLKEMGMGGFHIHCRTGMDTEYLGKEFMGLVKACNEKAKSEQMLCWLYDEDRWPSGAAGGLITKDYHCRARYINFSPVPKGKEFLKDRQEFEKVLNRNGKPAGYLMAVYRVTLKDGCLASYERLREETAVSGNNDQLWWAYMEIAKDDPWFNNQAYVNTLDPKAIQKFVDITHEAYYRELGSDFGKSIPAIFTDEPQFTHKESLSFAEEKREIKIPFTDDFSDTYIEAYGNDILDFLPELFWELPHEELSLARYHYHDHVCERFAAAFADTVGKWCGEHGIMLTGHMMEEPTLFSQTRALGEAMRSYRSFQLPGIDMLCDYREYSTAKQAQSAAHQYGRPGVLSELYGVTNWDFDFKEHKLQGDWQAAMGVTVRVHHLAWVSMGGEAKRDYPASIGYQSPWYKEYKLVEDHFSRVNTALTRGRPQVRIGVIHPIESYWLHWGPLEQTFMVREELENNFQNLIKWMLFGLIDFDFISESLLPSLCPDQATAPIRVGEMQYGVILVPACETLRSTTVERLEAFSEAGGRVIFAGKPARLVDAVKSNRPQELADRCLSIPLTMGSLLSALEDYRDIDVRFDDGTRSDDLIYQMRNEGECRWLFIAHALADSRIPYKSMEHPEISLKEKVIIRIKGIWNPVLFNTMNGETCPFPAQVKDGNTQLRLDFPIHDSLLLYLKPGSPCCCAGTNPEQQLVKTCVELTDPVTVTLSEPNVLLLDMAEYSLDGGEWQPEEEILRIDNVIRKTLNYPLRLSAMAQPWVEKAPEESHMLKLRFVIQSDIDIAACALALENAEKTRITVNGKSIPSKVTGWFTDESIKTVAPLLLCAGKNEIILEQPFGLKTNVEWCYLLGDFGVKVSGRHKQVVAPVRALAFGDWVHQGLPFYAGNVTYHCPIETDGGCLTLEATQFKNTLLSVSLDGAEKGKIAFAPYTLDLGFTEEGKHALQITAFGNRINAFGQVHNCDDDYLWFGPDSWRTEGNRWSYQYNLKPMGILISPKLQNIKE